MARRAITIVLLGLVTLCHPALAVAASSSSHLVVVLEGRRIDPRTTSLYHCHDLDHPVITCFRSRSVVEAIVGQRWSTGARVHGRTNVIGATSYIRVFVHASYQGSSIYLAADYENLADIGWNDVISSYRVQNNGSGVLYEHAGYWGTADLFCCNQLVPYVGDAMNDRISSTDRS